MSYPAKTSREAILAVALKHLTREGAEGLSLRAVATELGLAPNALYRYFADREALLGALSAEGARRLLQALRDAVGTRSGVPGIRALAHAYIGFARANPALYRAVLSRSHSPADQSDAFGELWSFMVSAVRPISGEEDAAIAAVTFWSFLIGVIALEQADFLDEGTTHPDLDFGLEVFLSGMMRRSSL